MGCYLAQLSLKILFNHFYFEYMFSYTLYYINAARTYRHIPATRGLCMTRCVSRYPSKLSPLITSMVM